MKINAIFVTVQILGALVFILNIIGNTKLSTKKVFVYNGVCNSLSVIQYSLLGSWTGALCCIIAVIRNIVFSKFKKDVPLIVILIYIVLVLLLNYRLVHSFLDIIPIVNIIIYAIALWTKKIMNIKIIGVFTCINGVFYDFINEAYVTVLNEFIDGIIGIRCIYILNKENNKKSKKKNKNKSRSRTK